MAKKIVKNESKVTVMGKVATVWTAKESTWKKVELQKINPEEVINYTVAVKEYKDKNSRDTYLKAVVTKNLGDNKRATVYFTPSKMLEETILQDEYLAKKARSESGVKLDPRTVVTFLLYNKKTRETLEARRLQGDIHKDDNVHF